MNKLFVTLFLLLCLGLGAQEAQNEAGEQEAVQQVDAGQQALRQEDAEVENPRQEDSAADNEPGINWDLDSYFDTEPEGTYHDPEATTSAPPINLRDKITVDVDYGLVTGFSPGWTEVPWYEGEREYNYILGAKLGVLLSLDLPLTDNLSVHNKLSFTLPDDDIFAIKEFYFEYNFLEKAYLLAGLYETVWGISRFYPFTNLPAMVPNNTKTAGDSYIARLTFPIGIGGLEFLSLTRYGYVDDFASPSFAEFAFGMKYNFALNKADIDTGFLYHRELPLRSFISVKTTLGTTELYSEGLVAVNINDSSKVYLSGNLGFLQDFFDSKVTVTGEMYYNGEPNAAWWRTESDLWEASTVNFYEGLNTALAVVYRPGFLGARVFAQTLYTFEQKSVWFVPGITIRPGGINITLSVPMVLGKRPEPGDTNNYYRNNDDRDNRPFSVVLGVTFDGKLRYSL